MSTYIIGDLQGCFTELCHLLDIINYNSSSDRLCFAGDLINRGPQSLECINFIRQLPPSTIITLGNHDLHCLACMHDASLIHQSDTLDGILASDECEAVEQWLRQQPICYWDKDLNFVLSHAGIYPLWSIEQAVAYSQEFETMLRGHDDRYIDFLKNMYGDEPAQWRDDLVADERLRFICNAFTRMRMIGSKGRLILTKQSTNLVDANVSDSLKATYPWFEYPERRNIKQTIYFGHWAALNGKTNRSNIIGLDTGCVWGNQLTAVRVEDGAVFSIDSLQPKRR